MKKQIIENKIFLYKTIDSLTEFRILESNFLYLSSFLEESKQLLKNSIELFEQGFFDCSFYCLRQSLELSTITCYLKNNSSKQKYTDWKNQKKFPTDQEIKTYLEYNNNFYKEIIIIFKEDFSKMRQSKQQLNKYVHKQGFNTFISKQQDLNKLKQDFIKHLDVCILGICLLRLSIDPFPILALEMNLNVYIDIMTPYISKEILNKYITSNKIELYKKTKIYKKFYTEILELPQRSETFINFREYFYIDLLSINEIVKYLFLLEKDELILLGISLILKEKVTEIKIDGLSYSTSLKLSNLGEFHFFTNDYEKIENNEFNKKLTTSYYSQINIGEYNLIIKHLIKLTEEEIKKVEEIKKMWI